MRATIILFGVVLGVITLGLLAAPALVGDRALRRRHAIDGGARAARRGPGGALPGAGAGAQSPPGDEGADDDDPPLSSSTPTVAFTADDVVIVDNPLLDGLEFEELNPAKLRELRVPATVPGVLIRAVDADSPAAAQHLQPNDVIVRIEDHAVASINELRRAVGARHMVRMTYFRNGAAFAVAFSLPKAGAAR